MSPYHTRNFFHNVSPHRSSRYNAVLDDETQSIELGRGVPLYDHLGRAGYKETENLSDKDYFKMDDLFKKDRDEFLKKNEIVDDNVTQRFRNNTFKIIEELPSSVASKYGDILTDLTNKFIQEHLSLKSKYNELLKTKNTSSTSQKREHEQGILIEKLTEKLKSYKAECADLQNEVDAKNNLISSLKNDLKSLRESEDRGVMSPSPKIKNAERQYTEEQEQDYSVLINKVKTGMSQIELEEELRIKRELQEKEYQILKQQLEDLKFERNRKSKQVLNRDLDNFKSELKTELGELFKGINKKVEEAPRISKSDNEENNDDELFNRLKDLIQKELRLNNQEMKEKFELLLQNKVNRDELEFLLLKSNVSRADQFKKTVSLFNSEENCKYCSNGKQNLKIEIDGMTEKIKKLSVQISQLENDDELNETELMSLISKRHLLRHQLRQKQDELEENFTYGEDATGEPLQESDNCHTINILRDNAKKFGIPLGKNTVY